MRAGAFISAVAHAIVLAWLLLGTAKPFDTAAADAVTVDLVPKDQAPPEPKYELNSPEVPTPEPEPKSKDLQIVLPSYEQKPQSEAAATPSRSDSASPAQRKAAAPPAPAVKQQATAQAKQPTTPAQQQPQTPPTAQQTQTQPTAQQQPQPPAQQPPPQQQPQQQAAAQPTPQQPAPQQQQEQPQSIFDPASIPKLMDLTPTPTPTAGAVPTIGFDAAADTAANLTRDEVSAFKARLKTCLRRPAGVGTERKLQVVMRVFLRRDGAFAADPMLVSAPAAREGPALVQAATEGLKACQPYALPAEKYNDWKMLDIPLSPGDMS